jgi:hypothetical protein
MYLLVKHLTGLLSPLVGHSPSHIRNSEDFSQKLNTVHLQKSDILVSFNMVSLFTKVLLEDTLQLLQVLTTMYFLYNSAFYNHTDSIAMGSPLTPVIANYYMEHFKQLAIIMVSRKPTHWYRYMDNTFVVWCHREEDLHDFLSHLNNIHPNIKFMMDVEQNQSLPFLNVLVSRRPDSSLGHRVYRKPMHTDLYLHAKSAHHPAQKKGVLTSLIQHAQELCDADNLDKEIEHLKKTFRKKWL